MEKSEIQDRVIKVVCSVLNVDKEMVKNESNFVFDLGAESMQSVQLVAAFEEDFDIEMDESALSVQTVGDAIEYITKYL